MAELKRYLDSPTARVRLIDLVRAQTAAVIDALAYPRLPIAGGSISSADYDAYVTAIEAATGSLVDLLANLGFYAATTLHDDLAVDVLRQLVGRPIHLSGNSAQIKSQRYPATLALFALGLGALANRRPAPLARALAEVTSREPHEPTQGLAYYLAPVDALDPEILKATEEFARRHTPSSDRVHARLRPHLQALIPSDDDYDNLFDDIEYLLGLAADRRCLRSRSRSGTRMAQPVRPVELRPTDQGAGLGRLRRRQWVTI